MQEPSLTEGPAHSLPTRTSDNLWPLTISPPFTVSYRFTQCVRYLDPARVAKSRV